MNNNLVRQIQIHEDFVASNQKTTGETQTFNHKNEVPPVSSHLISENSQEAEISSGDPAKNLFAGSTMSKEQLKAIESLQVVENIKANEVSLEKKPFKVEEIRAFSAQVRLNRTDKSVQFWRQL